MMPLLDVLSRASPFEIFISDWRRFTVEDVYLDTQNPRQISCRGSANSDGVPFLRKFATSQVVEFLVAVGRVAEGPIVFQDLGVRAASRFVDLVVPLCLESQCGLGVTLYDIESLAAV